MSEDAAYRRGVVEALGMAAEMAVKLGDVPALVQWCRDQQHEVRGPCPICREPAPRHRDVVTGRYARRHDAVREGLLW